MAEGVLFRARVCVAEIAANLLEHGSAHPGRDEIKLSLQQRGPAIEVEISDTGREFDPTRPATYSAAARRPEDTACAWYEPMLRE